MGVALGRLLIALAVLPGAAVAEPLRLGFAGRVTSIDPHFFVAPANVSTSMHLFDRLIHRTADSRLVPWIATSWGPVSDTAWEFKLRPGMRWHDGHVVTADDIAFTIDRVRNVPNSPGGFAGMVRTITDVEIVDPITVRLHTARPAPTLPTDLADIAIIARHVGTGATTEDYNSGKAAIGSGPYRLVAYAIGEHVELARNDSWWGPKSTWDRVQIRMIANSGARTAAMLSGDIDVMEFPPGSDLPRLRSDPRISVVSIVGLQTVLLAPDFSRTANPPFITDKAGARLPHNPLLDVRVRRALSLAINRQALATNVMEGTAEATGQWLPPGAFSYAKTVATPVADPTLARSLLAEAGYPDGFKIVLHTPNDRLPTDVATSLAVAQMWTRIGVPTQVESSPFAVFATRASRQEFSMRLMTWSSPTAEAGYMLVNVLGTRDPPRGRGMVNNGRYSNPVLDALVDRGLSTIDDVAREAILIQAVELATEDVATIPLYQVRNLWATRRNIHLTPRQDQRTLAMEIQP